jgi:hypothetical protein
MSATMGVFQRYAEHLSATQGLVVVGPDDPVRRAVVEGARVGLRLAGVDPEPILGRLDTLSVCLPLGVGGRSLVLLSRAAMQSADRAMETLGHEAHHDRQSDRGGHVRHAWDYVASPELRARFEAEAYAVGLWARYLLTGQVPDPHGSLVALGGPTYHLGEGELSLASGVLLSHVDTIRKGMCPPISTAVELLGWLRVEAPECIVPVEHRP